MPVTFNVADHSAKEVTGRTAGGALTPRQLLVGISQDSFDGPPRFLDVGRIRGTSFSKDSENL
ncbi:hypothetical protein R3P38DRAFT_3179925 [Favolaschia claudopus]